eukprot:1975189-Amphidinium_carterae.1
MPLLHSCFFFFFYLLFLLLIDKEVDENKLEYLDQSCCRINKVSHDMEAVWMPHSKQIRLPILRLDSSSLTLKRSCEKDFNPGDTS